MNHSDVHSSRPFRAAADRRRGFSGWTSAVAVAACALLLTGLAATPAAHASRSASGLVLQIYQSPYTTEQDSFTVSLQVANTTGIQFVYFTFCQLSSPLCYLPVAMKLQNTNWYVGTTEPMYNYSGMTVGVKAGYNITIVYADNSNVTEPAIPNTFSNLSISTSVTGEFMFQMTVSPQLFGLSGVVKDSASGAPVAGATVNLTPGNFTPVTTDSTGGYAFAGLLNGTYSVSVSRAGFHSSSSTVTIAGSSAVKDVALSNASRSTGGSDGGFPGGLLSGFTPILIAVAALAVVAGLVLLWRRKRGPASAGPEGAAGRPASPSGPEPPA